MKYAIDLHIHSALSPCSDDEMTPNNIVNMAMLKGLDIIAITDHNAAGNLQAICKCAEGTSLTVVPGMEIETAEEVHLICLFPNVDTAIMIQKEVFNALPSIENREDIFGRQLLMDEQDCVTGTLKQMLLTAANINIDDIFKMVREVNGIVIPAHIDRESYSIISNLGIVPEYLPVKYLEVSKICNLQEFLIKNPNYKNYNFVKSSDAHSLGDILERESFIELNQPTIECLFQELKKGKAAEVSGPPTASNLNKPKYI